MSNDRFKPKVIHNLENIELYKLLESGEFCIDERDNDIDFIYRSKDGLRIREFGNKTFYQSPNGASFIGTSTGTIASDLETINNIIVSGGGSIGITKFTKDFISADWVNGSIEILPIEHGKGNTKYLTIQVYENGIPNTTAIVNISVSNTGTVTISQTSGDFNGYIIII